MRTVHAKRASVCRLGATGNEFPQTPRFLDRYADCHGVKQETRTGQAATAPPSDDEYLTPEALSDLLYLPEKTLAAWRTQRKGPLFYRMGVHVRYPKTHLDLWLAECETQAKEWMKS